MIQIGHKIKNLRKQNNLTQEELADRCDLTKGFISQLERDFTSPSLSTLEDILNCLGTNFNEFFTDTSDEKIVYRDDDVFVKEYEDEGYKIHWLVYDAQKNEMEPICVSLDPGAQTEQQSPHEGEEFGYILSGSVTIILGEKRYKAKKGESFYFKSSQPHYIRNSGKTNAKILWVSSPPWF